MFICVKWVYVRVKCVCTQPDVHKFDLKFAYKYYGHRLTLMEIGSRSAVHRSNRNFCHQTINPSVRRILVSSSFPVLQDFRFYAGLLTAKCLHCVVESTVGMREKHYWLPSLLTVQMKTFFTSCFRVINCPNKMETMCINIMCVNVYVGFHNYYMRYYFKNLYRLSNCISIVDWMIGLFIQYFSTNNTPTIQIVQ